VPSLFLIAIVDSPFQVISPKLISAGKVEQFTPRVWGSAFAGDLTKSARQLSVLSLARSTPGPVVDHRASISATVAISAHPVPVAISASRLT
jgi:hypothetical protein